jgi:hypothetical protein
MVIFYFISKKKKMKHAYGLTLLAALALFLFSSSSSIVSILSLGVAVTPWEAIAKREEASYINMAALVPFLFNMNMDSGAVIKNLVIVGITFLLLHVLQEYMTLFDFGSTVKSTVHVAYNPATSKEVTYADGRSATVLQCMHDEQCPADHSCQLKALNGVQGKAACEKAWYNVFTPALCSKSHTRCSAVADCNEGETCKPATCSTQFCGKNKKCWGECRKNIATRKQ